MNRHRVLCIVCWLAAAPAFAQAPQVPPAAQPGAVQQRQIDEERRRREEELERRKTEVKPLKAPAEAASAVPAGDDTVRFKVRRIEFTRSAILSSEELDALAKDYLNREATLSDLKALVARINALYRSKGVVTAQAVIPPQDVSGGVVQIRLVEGRLGKVRLEGNASTRASYIESRLRLQPDDLIDLARLESALVRFNRTNDVQLQARLLPGETFAATDLVLTAIEPELHAPRATLDNMGTEATGKERAGLAYENRSLLGYRDDLGVSYTRADGQESWAATYAFPVNTWGGRLSLGHYQDGTALKHGSQASLHITGDSTAEIVSLRQPTSVDSDRELDLVAGWKRQRGKTWIDGVFLSESNLVTQNLGVEGQLFAEGSGWSGSVTHVFGHANAGNPNGFNLDRGSLRHSRDLGNGLSVSASLSWQIGPNDQLPSSEQMFLGGEGSVRGYRIGVYGGSSGEIVNLELHHPLLAAGEATHDIGARGFFFADYGRVRPYRPPDSTLPARQRLCGVGWGVQADLGNRISARLTLGFGLNTVPNQSSAEISLRVVASAF